MEPTGNLWAIHRDAFTALERAAKSDPTFAQIKKDQVLAAAAASRGAVARQRNGGRVGYIPIYGMITPRGDLLAGNTSHASIAEWLSYYATEPAFSAIVLDIDSPGGTVAGATETHAAIMKARDSGKPIFALANGTAASAAYWIASAATRIFATPSGEVGSIGVFARHLDISELEKRAGLKMTFVSAGKYKTELAPNAPLSADAKAYMQAQVNEAYLQFLRDIATGRGASLATVKADYGQGRMLTAKSALAAGMIDGIATLPALINIAANTGESFKRQAAAIERTRQNAPAEWHALQRSAEKYLEHKRNRRRSAANQTARPTHPAP